MRLLGDLTDELLYGGLPRTGSTAWADGKPLVFEVECFLSPTATTGARHEITVHPDWTVQTPHDIAAEKVAMAFGGYTSCVDLVEKGVPVMGRALGVMTRTVPLPITVDDRGHWRIPGDRTRHRSAAEAAAVLRATAMEGTVGVRGSHLAAMMEAAEKAWGSFRVPPWNHPAQHLVREHRGLQELWEAGIHPDLVTRWADLVDVGEPLPVRFFIAMAYVGVDEQALAGLVRACPDPDVATWLAWSPELVASGRDRLAHWLEIGLPRYAVLALVEAEVDPADARVLTDGLGVTLRRAGLELAGWAMVGCRPTPEQLIAVNGRQPVEFLPPLGALDHLCEQHPDLDRTDLGLMLALARTVPDVERWIASGAGTIDDVLAEEQGEAAQETVNKTETQGMGDD